jgi:RNA polymerase sigma factor for flagellar operon FliA
MVIERYYVGGKTMREIGDSMGINESRVSQIHRAALDKMAINLQAVGIHSADTLI